MAQSLRGSLRVGKGLTLAPGRMPIGGPTNGDDKPPYFDALSKLFPAEGVTLAPMVPTIAAGSKAWTFGLAAAIVTLIVALRAFATQPKEGGTPDWLAVGISVVSFLLYAETLQLFGLILTPVERHITLMTFATVFWVGLVPFIPTRR